MPAEWLAPVDAIALIRQAKAKGIRLLGFDGAFLDPDGIRLSQDDSWDYSSPAYLRVADPYGHAAQFIQERAAKGLHFEIVLDD